MGVFIGKNRSPQLISIARRDSFNFYEEEAQPNHQNQVFKSIVEKIRKLNEDLHLIFREYRNATPITEQKR